jgi:hypothetical protein
MKTKIEPGQLVAHKTQPSVPWVVLAGPSLTENPRDVIVAYVKPDGHRVHETVLEIELTQYVDGVGTAIDALIQAIRGEDMAPEVKSVLLQRAEELNDDYIDWTDTGGKDE